MKTSNYITLAFFTLLFGGVLALFVTAKFHKETNNDDGKLFAEDKFHKETNNDDGKLFAEDKKLEPFSVIVAESGANFQISTSENHCIRSFYRRPDSSKFPPYGVRNDTLFVLADTITNKGMMNYVVYCKDLKSIVAREHTNLYLREFIISGKDTLLVKLNKAKVNMFLDDEKNQIGGLRIEAQESEVYIHDSRLKTMDVNFDKSKIQTWNTSFAYLSGTIKNHSELYTNVLEKISVSVDPTSNFNISK